MPSSLPGLSGQRALPPSGECTGWRPGHNSPPFFSGPGIGLPYHSLQGRPGAPSSARAAGKGHVDLR